MTLYWWTHWFWITTLIVTILSLPIISVDTYPINPPYGNKEYNKDKPLKFPIAAQTDTDDIFTSGDEILSAVFRDSKFLRISKDSDRNNNARSNDNKIIVNRNGNISEVPDQNININDKFTSDHTVKINRTKGFDHNLSNNTYSSLISTQSSLELLSETITSMSSVVTDPIDLNNNLMNYTTMIPILNNSESNDYENDEPLNDSLEEYLVNKTVSFPPTTISTISTPTINSDIVNDIKKSNSKTYNLKNITKEEEIIRAEIERQLNGERSRKSKELAEYRQELKYINFSSDSKNLLARSAAVSLDDFEDDGNVSSEALSIQRAYILDAGAISGICLAVVGLCSAIALSAIVLYRRRYINKPQTLSEPDSSGYIDDSTIRDNSDEMYSLDNDSFLNSLEAMTIQNYWTDTVKHTKL